MNPILIPHLKKACQLSDTQSSFIDSAVYLGYFLAAIPAGLFIHRWGYKNGIIFGLMLFAFGSLLFIPASMVREYWFFLTALFIAACGATFLETIANPYATVLGNPATAEQRLNFAQSFNGVGAFVAPLIGSKFIFSGIEHSNEELQQMSPDQLNTYLNSEAATVQLPYLVIGVVIIIVIILFAITKLPEIKEDDSAAHGTKFSLNVFKFSHVKWATLAEFCYVGAQVGIGSFFIRFSKELMNLDEKTAGYWWGIALAGFMLGRFAGTFFMTYIKPAKLLSIYAIINIALLAFALINHNQFSVYAVMIVPFFMSIMFPTIFALGIKGLGEETKIASSFLVMSIIGGGIFAPIMGLISDKTGSMQSAYIVPVTCFAVILFFGLRGHKIKTTSNIESYEKVLSGVGSKG